MYVYMYFKNYLNLNYNNLLVYSEITEKYNFDFITIR